MQFTFNHDTNGLLPFLLTTGKYVQDELLPAGYDNELLLNRSRFLLTELCTNGIKHAGVPASTFDLYTADNHLIIERRDNGKQFSPRIKGERIPMPLPATIDVTTLTEDDINRLVMQRLTEYSVRLYVEEIQVKNDLSQQIINEHFGLIIICSSADRFTYCYDVEKGVNIFTAELRL